MDALTFNAELAKHLRGLKKNTGATRIQQGYKGTGSQAHRRQIFVTWDNAGELGASIDLWLESGRIQLGGVLARPSGGRYGCHEFPTPRYIQYEDKNPAQVYHEVEAALLAWGIEP